MTNENTQLESGETYEEVAAPEVSEEASPTEAIAEAPVESDQDRNWREVRQAMSQMAMQNEELRQELASLKPSEPPPQEIDLPDDEWITGKEAKSFASQYVKKVVDDQMKSYVAQQEESTAEGRLKSRFSDYDKVVTNDAVNKLKEEDPEFVKAIRDSKASTYDKGAAVYNYLRRLYPPHAMAQQNQKQIEKNANKPRPLDAVGRSSPLAAVDANGGVLTPELQRAFYQDMKRAAASG